MRNANNEAHRIRLEEKNRKDEEDSPPAPPPPPETVKQLPVKVPPAPETTILTPQPLSPPANDLQDLVKSNGLDLRDFDNDTSSPFDNMELKTINDMEELAQVLQPTAQWVPPAKLENILKELTLEEPQEEEKEKQTKMQGDNQEQEDKRNDSNKRSVSIIVQELQRELARPIMENWKPWPDLESPDCDTGISITKQDNSTCTSFSKLSNPLMDLSEENQKLAKHLSDMGFPLSRAARAINDLGGQDNKKVVEYLLAVQSLEEFGISGDDAEKALALTQYDQDKAKEYYENLRTLRDLGFPEDKASLALLKCNIDRDRALDFLVA
ncbi:uncharacterized protein LOC107272148 isoform X2 [Cephus cinctus]|nr:uncharacterized protein LOC107272148 isoform X2 [Cephus cinctus]